MRQYDDVGSIPILVVFCTYGALLATFFFFLWRVLIEEGEMDSDLRCVLVAAVGIILVLIAFRPLSWRSHISGGILPRVRQALRNPAFLSVSGGAFSFLMLAKNFSEMITLVFWAALVVATGFFLFSFLEL